MIYLFTNRGGGLGFIEKFAAFCAENQCHGTVVFSTSNWQKLPWYHLLGQFPGNLLVRWRLARQPFLSVLFVKDINQGGFVRRIRRGDHGLVGGFDQIFGAPLINRFDSLVNLHTSVLPYYRGPVPTYWVLLNQESYTGYTLHRVSERIDTGEILFQESLPIEPGEAEPALRDRLWQAGQLALLAWLHHVVLGSEFRRRVEDADAVYRVKENYNSYPQALPE